MISEGDPAATANGIAEAGVLADGGARENESAPQKPKKKSTPILRNKLALLEVINRKKFGYEVDYKAIATRHNTTPGALRQLYYRWTKDLIELHEPRTAEDRKIEETVQNAKSTHLLRESEQFLNDLHEGQLFKAQELAATGEVATAMKILEDLFRLRVSLIRCQESNERRIAALHDALRKRREAEEQERMLAAKTIGVVPVPVSVADEAARLRDAFAMPATPEPES
jgi:hypothetical protein